MSYQRSNQFQGRSYISDPNFSPQHHQFPNSPKPCSFFAQGNCRFGTDCRFSHFLPPQSFFPPSPPPPPPVIVNISPDNPVFSIDVECVATDVSHNARALAQIAVVDFSGNCIFNAYIKQEVPVKSYITSLTGLTEEVLETRGIPLEEAMAGLRASLPPSAVIVGQSVLKDVQWLKLVQGTDYHSLVDLSAIFRVWNPSRGEFTSFSQDHVARVWLGPQAVDRPHHNASEDASLSMGLFRAYLAVQWDVHRLYDLQMNTLMAPRVPGFSSLNPVVDGCWCEE